jgi:hypothetical protein
MPKKVSRSKVGTKVIAGNAKQSEAERLRFAEEERNTRSRAGKKAVGALRTLTAYEKMKKKIEGYDTESLGRSNEDIDCIMMAFCNGDMTIDESIELTKLILERTQAELTRLELRRDQLMNYPSKQFAKITVN